MQARNTTHCPRMPDIVTGLDAPVAHACIPLQFDAVTRGVLNVAARSGEVFSEEELRFLDTLGHQISLAVARGRHREAERLRNQEARAMAALSKAVGGSLEPQAVLAAVASTARAPWRAPGSTTARAEPCRMSGTRKSGSSRARRWRCWGRSPPAWPTRCAIR